MTHFSKTDRLFIDRLEESMVLNDREKEYVTYDYDYYEDIIPHLVNMFPTSILLLTFILIPLFFHQYPITVLPLAFLGLLFLTDLRIKNNKGETAYDLAKSNPAFKNEECLEMLKKGAENE